jgi:colicin import membrane protein
MTETIKPGPEQKQRTSAGRSGSHYQIPKEPGKHAALILAGAMHVLLFLFLWVGIHWQSKTPVGVDAEIWDVKTREAAPEPVAVTPPPPPQPEVPPEPPRPSPQEVQEAHDAEIALERAKEKEIADKKLKEEQKRQEELAAKEQQKRDKEKALADKKIEAKLEKQRDDDLKRMLGNVAGNGTTGDAAKSTGNNRVDAGYAGRIAAKIKSNMVYVGSDSGPDNPTVEFRIDLFPDGSLRGPVKKTKSSGVAAFDDAVERAISKAAPYPADKSGNVPSTIPLTYRLKD